MSASDEIARIRSEYQRRERDIAPGFYDFDKPANLFALHGRERALLELLRTLDLLPLGERRLLEVGCGNGEWFASFERLGLKRNHLAGVDLDEERIEKARARAPEAHLRVAEASSLPWAEATFDVVFQATVFSSILDSQVQRAVAAEMKRVLKPKGTLLWYDFSYDNPKNPNVRGVRLRDLRALFPGASVAAKRVTLAPPLARWLVPHGWAAATLLEAARVLNTHWLAALRFD